ncbi:MAG: zinc-ribbon domain-containing protein [Ruminococcaceae bacterium]|nr:zinc-ribbon domain-containing protein [Oscillospiraceae bacterium]
MDFLDNAVEKAKDFFEVACKKTNEVVTTQKQKFDVASEKAKRAKDFEKLGEIYYELIKDDENVDNQTRELVNSITEKNEKINSINEEINAAKNKRICAKCGALVEENAVFCSKCGEKIIIDSEEE